MSYKHPVTCEASRTVFTCISHDLVVVLDKLKICKLSDLGRSLSTIAAEYKSTVHDIVKSREKLQMEIEDSDCVKKRKIVSKADYPELYKAVYHWFV